MKSPVIKASDLGNVTLVISPKKITRFLTLSIGLLLIGHIGAFIEDYVRHAHSTLAKNIIKWFDFNLEYNIPTWFSVIILFLAALLLFVIYLPKRLNRSKDAIYWIVLAFFFVFLSIDESVGFHEEIAKLLRPELGNNASSFLYWAWVIPYGMFVISAGLFFLRFVLGLPIKTRNLFILSSAMYILGALGLEFVEGYLYVHYGLDHIYNRILYCLEELLEMGGVVVFIHALLSYMEANKMKLIIAQK